MMIIIGLLMIIFASREYVEGCGDRLGANVVMCIINGDIKEFFDFSLCSHASIETSFKCKDEVCQPYFKQGIEPVAKRFLAAIPSGAFFSIESSMDAYFSTPQRRTNTIAVIVDFLVGEKFSYAHFSEFTWDPKFNKAANRNTLALLRELAGPLHKRNKHIGLDVQLRSNSLEAEYNFPDLSRYVDWYNISPHKKPKREGEYFYMDPRLPLKDDVNNEPGSIKWALELLLQNVQPQCIVMKIYTYGRRYISIEDATDPGIGSLAAKTYVGEPYKDICAKLADESCREYWDEPSETPYAVCEKSVYSYDNSRSTMRKIEFIKTYNVTRASLFTVEHDDVENVCRNGTYPILRAMQGMRKKLSNIGVTLPDCLSHLS